MTNRYARQIILPEIGEEGQKKLAAASVLIAGAGGLGSPAAIYLAAAGVGHLTIADADEVRIHNLNRQILYNEGDLGRPKKDCALTNLKRFNGTIEVTAFGKIDSAGLQGLLSERKYSAVIDGTDNFQTRYIINDSCVETGVPYIYGSALGWKGQISVFATKGGPCYKCVYPEPPAPEDSPTCVRGGIIGAVAGSVGCMQANEAIKLIAGSGKTLTGSMLLLDFLNLDFKIFELGRDPKCIVCGVD